MTPRATVLHTLPSTLTLLCAAILLSACAPMGAHYSQAQLPATVQVPDGHQPALHTVGVGKIADECRAKKDANGHEWVVVGPDAALHDRKGMQVGTYIQRVATSGGVAPGSTCSAETVGAKQWVPCQSVKMRLDKLPPLQPEQLFELTLEPATGSPAGRPTGSVLYIGRAVKVM